MKGGQRRLFQLELSDFQNFISLEEWESACFEGSTIVNTNFQVELFQISTAWMLPSDKKMFIKGFLYLTIQAIMSHQANIFFEENYYRLSKEAFNAIHNPSSPSEGMIRFIKGLENFVFGVMVPENPIKEGIHLFYAEEIREFRAYAVPVPLDNPQLADEITTEASTYTFHQINFSEIHSKFDKIYLYSHMPGGIIVVK